MKKDREISEEFTVAMEHYLAKSNMNLTRLAEVTGISLGYLSRLKKGERKAPSVPIAINIAKTLKMPNSYILKILDIVEPDEDRTPDLYELILFKDFHIEGEQLETEAREVIVDILQSIITSEWSNTTIPQDMMILVGKISDLKLHIRV